MASPTVLAIDSDYGSDFSPEEEALLELLLSSSSPKTEVVEENPIANEIEYHGQPQTVRVLRVLDGERKLLPSETCASEATINTIIPHPVDPGYPDLSDNISLFHTPEEPADSEAVFTAENDSRSPLERFRTRPSKPLSVTDLVSPAWCELQYFYTMKYHGRKRRTSAMKRGSTVHQKLEKEVYTTVKVDIATKEDAWGLRIWNVIQGIYTLRSLGHTRELEVWGTIDGQVVNGVIDEVSFICPDVELEELQKKAKKNDLPPDQQTLDQFLTDSGGKSLTRLNRAAHSKRHSESNKAYICDVKTRGAATLPSEVAMRSTKYQLMLYHRLLTRLVSNLVDFSMLCERYMLDPNIQFSDSFIAQIGNLNGAFFDDSSSSSSIEDSISSPDSIAKLLAHNSLSKLWSLMISEFQAILPNGTESIGSILKAEYRRSSSGEIMGSKTFPMDEEVLNQYIRHEMEWWKGERAPAGVVVEEAYKCRSCDFADGCEWRLAQIEEARQRARRHKKVELKSRMRVDDDLW